MTEDSTITSDPLRVPITAQKKAQGGVILRGLKSILLLSQAELDRLVAFIRDEPLKARLQRYVIAPRPPQKRPTTATVNSVHAAIGLDSCAWGQVVNCGSLSISCELRPVNGRG